MVNSLVESLLVVVASLVAIAVFLAFVNAVKSRKQAGDSDADGGGKWWSMKYLWEIPISLVVVAAFWGVLGASGGTSSGSAGTWLQAIQAPSLARVVEIKNDYWFHILFVLGIIYFLAARAEKKETKEASQAIVAIVAIVAFMLFIGFPMWVWVTGPSTAAAASNAQVLSMPPGGKSELISIPPGKSVVVNGEDIRLHCGYRDGHEESYLAGERPCSDGDKPFVWATNLRANKPNAITYFYK